MKKLKKTTFLKIIATTCLFLAGKVEETPKKLKDVINTCYQLRQENQVPLTKETYETLRKTILQNEYSVLKALHFDLTVEHPYKYLLFFIKSIQGIYLISKLNA